MSELLSLDAQAALRAAMRASLATFVARACREIEPSRLFVPSPHIDIVADHLERLHGGDLQRLIVNLPPRHLKSIVTSVCFVAWVLGHNPGFRFVLVSYGSDVVERHLRFIRQIMKADWYLQLFPATRISRRKDTNIEIETTAGGAVFATTIEGVLTGRGGDCFIVDDPIKASDSTHPNRLKSVNEWVSHTLINRLDSKARGRVVVVMQRLHMDDLSGHLLETGGWTHLSLPAIAQERESYTLTSGHTFLREEGEVLFRPETRAILERVRSEIGWPAFSAQYLQAPKPESGNLLQPEWLARYDALPEPHPADRIVQGLGPKHQGRGQQRLFGLRDRPAVRARQGLLRPLHVAGAPAVSAASENDHPATPASQGELRTDRGGCPRSRHDPGPAPSRSSQSSRGQAEGRQDRPHPRTVHAAGIRAGPVSKERQLVERLRRRVPGFPAGTS
jgi:hypothetical protein